MYYIEEGRSILTISFEKAEELVRKYSGTGRSINAKKESVDFGIIIGKFIDQDTRKIYDTTVGTIHYSKTGAHIVPGKPKDGEG